MHTAMTSIPANNFPSGYYLYTNPSGVYSTITSLQVENYDSSSEFTVQLLEVYPTGVPTTMTHYITTGVIMTTRSNLPVTNIHKKCLSNLGSKIYAAASGQVEIYVNYIYTDAPFGRFDGYNGGMDNGKM